MKCHKIYSFSLLLLDGLNVSVNRLSTTSLIISWALDQSLTAASYTISYSNIDTDCYPVSTTMIPGIPGSERMYTLTGLEEGTEYSITVTATITGGGGSEQHTITAATMGAGQYNT